MILCSHWSLSCRNKSMFQVAPEQLAADSQEQHSVSQVAPEQLPADSQEQHRTVSETVLPWKQMYMAAHSEHWFHHWYTTVTNCIRNYQHWITWALNLYVIILFLQYTTKLYVPPACLSKPERSLTPQLDIVIIEEPSLLCASRTASHNPHLAHHSSGKGWASLIPRPKEEEEEEKGPGFSHSRMCLPGLLEG